MSKRERRLRMIERRWLARFGEPPSLRTDPGLMERILDADVARAVTAFKAPLSGSG